MNIYLVKRTDTIDYDEYDAVVVCEATPQRARKFSEDYWHFTHHQYVVCKLIGIAKENQKAGEILTSFNAG